ncbi:hypothetical protein MRX96_056969 [Rhipicephalus microplus]
MDQPYTDYTDKQVLTDMRAACRTGTIVRGVKDPSPLIKLPGFSPAWSWCPDYMHCILLGVSRQLTELWFSDTGTEALNNDPAEDPKTQTCVNESSQGPCPLGEIELPSAFCSKIPLPCDANALFFAWHTGTEPCDVRVSKFVTFLMSIEAAATQENFYTCSVFCHGIKMEELCVNKEFDPAKALKKVDEIRLCPGYGVVPVTNGQCMRFANNINRNTGKEKQKLLKMRQCQ